MAKSRSATASSELRMEVTPSAGGSPSVDPASAPAPSGDTAACPSANANRARSRSSISTQAWRWWPTVTGCARCRCVYPGSGVAASGSARSRMTPQNSRSASRASQQASTT